MAEQSTAQLEAKGKTTEISEVFSSLQGEGPYLGKKQIFVRFGQCNMHCIYCDELEKMQKGIFEKIEVSQVIENILQLERDDGPHHSVSLTGGEPLMYTDAVASIADELKKSKLRLYLETNGTLDKQLEKIVGSIDIVAMDIKPPSSSQDKAYWKEHKSFLKIAYDNTKVFAKIIVTSRLSKEDIIKSVDLIHSVSPSIPLIFQPESEITGINLEALKNIRNDFYSVASKHLSDVRIIPQMHKIWGIR